MLKPLFIAYTAGFLLLLLLSAAVVIAMMLNLLFGAWDQSNYLMIDEDAVTIVVRRPNMSPLHVTVFFDEIRLVTSSRPPRAPSFLEVGIDEQTEALMLYAMASRPNIVIYLKEPKQVAWTRFRRLVVPRLEKSDCSFRRIIFAASPHEGCMKALSEALR